MTADELKALIHNGDCGQVLAALEGAQSGAKPALIKAAFQFLKDQETDVDRHLNIAYSDEYSRRKFSSWLVIHRLGSWTDIQKLHKSGYYNLSRETFGRLYEFLSPFLERDRPVWLDKWATFMLENGWDIDWPCVRKLMKAGLISRPATDRYLLAMPRDPDFLRANPDCLQNEVFDLFRLLPRSCKQLFWEDVTPDNGEAYISGKYYSHPGFPFCWTLGRLAKEGLVDRVRLLTASLEALQMGRHPNDAAWFYRFHEFLVPTIEERVAFQRTYCDLLTTGVSTVVNFALHAIGELITAGRLDPAHYFASADRVFGLKNKGTAIMVLKQLEQIAQSDKSLKVDVAVVAASGLGHETPVVQKAVLKTLEGLKLEPDERVASRIQFHLESVAASLYDRAQNLLNRLSAGTSVATIKAMLPPATLMPQSAVTSLNTTSRLAPDREIVPIATLDEFIAEASAAIENFNHSEQLERLLDALSRLCDQRPADLDARKQPLINRVLKLSENKSAVTEVNLLGRLMLSILIWDEAQPRLRRDDAEDTGVEALPGPAVIRECPTEAAVASTNTVKRKHFADLSKWYERAPMLGFLDSRITELNERVRRCDARPLLAAPTHAGGWIAANVFVQRLQVLEKAGLDPQSFDLRQALLRLAPEGRDDALQRASGLTGSRQIAIEWALGQRQPTTEREVKVSIAARAGRDPFAPIVASDNPTVLEPLTWDWKVSRAAYDGREQQCWTLTLTTSPDCLTHQLFRFPPLTLYPIALQAALSHRTEGKIKSLAEIWPGNLAPFFAAGAVAIVSELETINNRCKHFPEFLPLLFDSHVPFSDMAQLLLAAALLAKSADIRGLAVDVLIAVTEDGRCLGPELGAVLRRMLPSGMIRPNRLVDSLQTAARSSPRHMLMSALTVQSLFSELESIPDDAYHLLSPLLDWLAELHRPLEAAFQAGLSHVSGSGKTAKLAKSLLKQDQALQR